MKRKRSKTASGTLADSPAARRDKSGWPILPGEDALRLVREAGGMAAPDFAAVSGRIFGGRKFEGDAVEIERAGYDTRQRKAAKAEGLEVKP